jgi:hypothetical protein
LFGNDSDSEDSEIDIKPKALPKIGGSGSQNPAAQKKKALFEDETDESMIQEEQPPPKKAQTQAPPVQVAPV